MITKFLSGHKSTHVTPQRVLEATQSKGDCCPQMTPPLSDPNIAGKSQKLSRRKISFPPWCRSVSPTQGKWLVQSGMKAHIVPLQPPRFPCVFPSLSSPQPKIWKGALQVPLQYFRQLQWIWQLNVK